MEKEIKKGWLKLFFCVCTFLYMAIKCLDYTHGNHFIKEKKALLRKAGLNDLSRAV